MTPPVEAKGNDKNNANRVILSASEGSKARNEDMLYM